MGGAGWSLKGPQPRLQESLALSCTPVGSARHTPPPSSAPACPPGLPVDPLQAFPCCPWQPSGPVGTTLWCAFSQSPPPPPPGMGLGHGQ